MRKDYLTPEIEVMKYNVKDVVTYVDSDVYTTKSSITNADDWSGIFG